MIREITENQKADYNNFVATNSSGSFLQSWEWGEWQAALGREVFRFEVLNESKARVGVVQLIKMVFFKGKYYLYAPYGPVGAEADSKIVLELRNKFSDAIFIRIEPKNNFLPTASYPPSKTINIQPGKSLVIDLSKSETELLAQMHPKTRYNIKLGQKHGVSIADEFAISVGHGLFFDEALELILGTARRQKFTGYGKEYYKKLVDFFSLQNPADVRLGIYKAIFQNQLLSASIMVDFGNTRTFLFGGSSEYHKNVMAPYLLHWQAMLDAKMRGLKFYDFWGVETSGGETPGFVRFKLGFGGEVKSYSGAYDIIGNKFWYKVYRGLRLANKLAKKISR